MGRRDAQGHEQLTDAGLEKLADIKTLRMLELPSCRRLTDSTLSALATLTALSHLDLSYCWKVGQ